MDRIVSLEEMFNTTFPKLAPEYSEEVYFGINNSFSSEMIVHAKNLRNVLKDLLGGDWEDESKRTIIIKNALSKEKDDENGNKLQKVLDDMGDCIARNCNIEKCYIGLSNDINAHTLPMTFDSSILLDYDKKPIIKKFGELFINNNAVKTDDEIQKGLTKLEDIVINKDGYKFKEKTGKIFIINLGIPIIVDMKFGSSPEDLCAVIFHEIGHNFQQVLRGANQMMIQTYTKFYLSFLSNQHFANIFGYIDSILINSYLMRVIIHCKLSNYSRFSIIRILLSGSIFVDKNGEIITREDIGDIERENIMRVVAAAKENNHLNELSTFTRVMSTIGASFTKICSLIFLPLSIIHRNITNEGLNKDYGDVIKENKIYEQFADTFAVSYGFGSSSSKFYIEIQKYIKDLNKPSYANILNYIPILSTAAAINEFNRRVMVINCIGYDENHVRIAQAYRVLEYELQNNSSLSSKLKDEIREHMNVIKEDYDKYIKMEMDNYNTNPNIIKAIMKRFRDGDISSVADNSGIVDGVLDVMKEYEQTGIIKQPPIVKEFQKNTEGPAAISNKFADKIVLGFGGIKEFLMKTAGFNTSEIK